MKIGRIAPKLKGRDPDRWKPPHFPLTMRPMALVNVEGQPESKRLRGGKRSRRRVLKNRWQPR